MDERRTDTREAIRSVALELFAEQSYDKTSLREISERLGVTKAAVYYHFKTKEEILVSLIEDFLAQVDDVVDWAQSQPATAATRHEVASLQRPAGRADHAARPVYAGRPGSHPRFGRGHRDAQAVGPPGRHPDHPRRAAVLPTSAQGSL